MKLSCVYSLEHENHHFIANLVTWKVLIGISWRQIILALVNIVFHSFFCNRESTTIIERQLHRFPGKDKRSIANLLIVTSALFFIIPKRKVKALRYPTGRKGCAWFQLLPRNPGNPRGQRIALSLPKTFMLKCSNSLLAIRNCYSKLIYSFTHKNIIEDPIIFLGTRDISQ